MSWDGWCITFDEVVIEEYPVFRANLEMSIEIYTRAVTVNKMCCHTNDMKRIFTVYMLLTDSPDMQILKCPVTELDIQKCSF